MLFPVFDQRRRHGVAPQDPRWVAENEHAGADVAGQQRVHGDGDHGAEGQIVGDGAGIAEETVRADADALAGGGQRTYRGSPADQVVAPDDRVPDHLDERPDDGSVADDATGVEDGAVSDRGAGIDLGGGMDQGDVAVVREVQPLENAGKGVAAGV